MVTVASETETFPQTLDPFTHQRLPAPPPARRAGRPVVPHLIELRRDDPDRSVPKVSEIAAQTAHGRPIVAPDPTAPTTARGTSMTTGTSTQDSALTPRWAPLHQRPPPNSEVGWDNLNAVEQMILVVASREHTLQHACVSWADQPGRLAEIELTKAVASTLNHRGLIGFYRVDDGYPDLSSQDLSTVFTGHSYWDARHANSRRVGMFLTTVGEDTVLGP